MIAPRVVGIALITTFIGSAVIAQTVTNKPISAEPLIANPTITKPLNSAVNPAAVRVNPAINPGRIRSDGYRLVDKEKTTNGLEAVNPAAVKMNPGRIRSDDSAHLSAAERLIKGTFAKEKTTQGLEAVNPAAVKMNSVKGNIQQQTAPSLQKMQ